MARHEFLTDAMWKKLEPLLPRLPKGKKGGRPWVDNRSCLEGILWILKTGARWRDLPEQYPSPATCWRRLKLWEEEGVWLDIWQTLLGELDAKGRLRWEEAFADASFAPAKKGAPKSGKPSGERARNGWWWSMARAYLWAAGSSPPPRRRSRSSNRRSRPSESRGRGGVGRKRSRSG
jgi:transposase